MHDIYCQDKYDNDAIAALMTSINKCGIIVRHKGNKYLGLFECFFKIMQCLDSVYVKIHF